MKQADKFKASVTRLLLQGRQLFAKNDKVPVYTVYVIL